MSKKHALSDAQLRRNIELAYKLMPIESRKLFIIKLMTDAGYVCIGEDGDELYFDRSVH